MVPFCTDMSQTTCLCFEMIRAPPQQTELAKLEEISNKLFHHIRHELPQVSKQSQQDRSWLTESKRCCSALKRSSCTGRSCNPAQMMVFAMQPVPSHIALDFWSFPLVFLLPSRLPCCPITLHATSVKGRQEHCLKEKRSETNTRMLYGICDTEAKA